MAKWATPRRGSNGGNLSGVFDIGTVLLFYKRQFPNHDHMALKGRMRSPNCMGQYKCNLAVLAAWHCEKTLRLHQDINGVRQGSKPGVVCCVIIVDLGQDFGYGPKHKEILKNLFQSIYVTIKPDAKVSFVGIHGKLFCQTYILILH